MKTSQFPIKAEDETVEYVVGTIAGPDGEKKLRRIPLDEVGSTGPAGPEGAAGLGAWDAIVRKLVDQTVTGSSDLVVDSELTYDLEDGESYQIEAIILYTGNEANGMKILFGFPELEKVSQVVGTTLGLNTSDSPINTAGIGALSSFPSSFITVGVDYTDGTTRALVVRFTIVNAVAGALAFSFATALGNPSDEVTVKVGSSLKIVKL